jgi:cell division protein FtsL
MEATEYGLRKVVQNHPIVREIDEVRQREMWQWVWMGVVLVLVLLISTWLRGRLLQHAYQMGRLQDTRAAEQATNRQLRLDIETLSSPKRIEDLATGRLQMIAPGLDDAFVLERVMAPKRPPSSVVAAR